MTPEQIRKSVMYTRALDSARNGDSITETLTKLLESKHTKIQVNRGHGEWLVSMALVIQQAHRDVSPIIPKYTTFEE
jgi:hypothetical protein